jgi:predicted ArsR family transcriptional regulator
MGRGKQRVRIPVWAVAKAVGLSEQAVRRHVREGEYDARDLLSVIGYVRKRGGLDERE